MATLGRLDTPLLLAALAAVLAIRIDLLLATDFPINDGALFFVFVQAVAHTFPLLPAFTAYNGLEIPFAYPPLSFWLSAAAVQLGASPLALVHRAPIVMNVAWVLAFAWLLLRTGHARLFTAVAVLVFGTTFRSYEWLVMGGGLSRGLGSLLLLAALHALLPAGLWRGSGWDRRRLVAGGACIGAAVLSHLEWGLLAAFCGLCCLALAQHRWQPLAAGSMALGAVAGAVALPWIAWVLATHGAAPFLAAAQTGGAPLRLANGGGMLLRSATVLLPVALFGAALLLPVRGRFWLLLAAASVWLVPRSGETPLALATGVWVATGALGLWVALQRAPQPHAAASTAFVAAACVLLGVRALDAAQRPEHFTALPSEARSAMAWVAAHHPGRRFALVREAPWEYNGVAEWFPVLAGAVNTTTVQGREWLAEGAFARAERRLQALDGSLSCRQVLRGLRQLPAADYLWVEGIDLQARAAVLDRRARHRPLSEWLEGWQRRLRGDPPVHRVGTPGALRGPGTLAGCFDAAGWREVHANARVRIFQVPDAAKVASPAAAD